jgi:hypothetical protein
MPGALKAPCFNRGQTKQMFNSLKSNKMNGITNLQISDRKINPYGGINFIISAMREKKINELIDNHLGKRPKQAQYSYSDILLGWIYSNLCGAERIEDIHQCRDLFNIPDLKMPSSDRVSQIFRALASETEIFKSVGGTKHKFNIHTGLNNLMLDLILKLNVINKNATNTMDYDNTVINCEKYDSEVSYLQTKGYQPGVCFINKIPVYIENRNGNSPAQYKIRDTVERGLTMLKDKGISVSRFRSDSAACTKDMFMYLDINPNIEYFIKFHKHRNSFTKVTVIYDWEELPRYGVKIACLRYTLYGKKRRFILIRKTNDIDPNNYAAILTNNESLSNKEVYYFYTKRGAMERNFDDLKNNFNWSRLPFSFLNENTVFLIISALAYIIYQYVLRVFSKKVDFVKKNFWLKNFIFNFITIGSEWDEGQTLRLYTQKPYYLLL